MNHDKNIKVQVKNIKWCKTKVLTYLHYNKNKNVNIKITKQDYGTKLYFKLMLNKLKVIGVPSKKVSWRFPTCSSTRETS